MPGKLKLELDGLKVESFEADAQTYGSGTVRGAELFASVVDGTCVDYTCRNYGTCRVAGQCVTVP